MIGDLRIDDCRLSIGGCMVAPWAGVWFSCSGHGSMVVRGFCFVKFGSVFLSWECAECWIPAYAGMT